MKESDKSYILILLLFILSGVISWALYFKVYRQKDTIDIHQFPKTIGDWTSQDLLITDQEYAILETRNAFARRYFTPYGKEVYLLIVYSQNNRKVSHPPEICYTGSGVTILGNYRDSFNVNTNSSQPLVVNVNKLLLEQRDLRQISFYWFKVGNSFTTNYWQQQGLIALKTFFGKSASSALIRVSITIKDSEQKALSDLKEFSQQIMPFLLTYLL